MNNEHEDLHFEVGDLDSITDAWERFSALVMPRLREKLSKETLEMMRGAFGLGAQMTLNILQNNKTNTKTIEEALARTKLLVKEINEFNHYE